MVYIEANISKSIDSIALSNLSVTEAACLAALHVKVMTIVMTEEYQSLTKTLRSNMQNAQEANAELGSFLRSQLTASTAA